MGNRLLQPGVSRGLSYVWTKQEATAIVQNLLIWPTSEVYFDEGGQPSTDQFLLDFRITSLIPSPFGTSSTSFLPLSNPEPALDGQSTPISAISAISTTPLTVIEEQVSHSIRLPQTFKRSTGQLSAAGAIAPLPDYDITLKHSTPGRRHHFIWRWEALLIVAVLLIAVLAQGINMFHYPYYEDDEGTYMSQAWAVVHLGRLAYYTYWYDHAPGGWLQIAAWNFIIDGFHTFGPAINSGRVLMLLLQAGSTFMLYCIARSISRNTAVAVIISLLFALSPYGIYFHRRVLLDNITTFWMLLSILLLVSGRLSRKRVCLSAAALGISILSKELTIFLVPVLAYLVFYRADRHRWFTMIGWIALVGSVISLYVLMAAQKGELFPPGTLFGGTSPHLSLLGTLQFQASRGRDGGLLDIHSGFWQMTKAWAQDDPMLLVGGSLCALFSVLVMKTQRLIGVIGLATLSLYAFLGRGGEIYGFYLMPLLPLLALNVGLVLGLVIKWMKTLLAGPSGIAVTRIILAGTVGLCLCSLWAGYTSSDLGFKYNPLVLWNSSQADAQNETTQWIEKNLPLGSHMIIDESMWTDLHDSGFTSAHYYWKVQYEPAVRDELLHNDWRNVDYVVTTTQMLTDAQQAHLTLVEDAIMHSTPIAHFETGGWPVEIRKINK